MSALRKLAVAELVVFLSLLGVLGTAFSVGAAPAGLDGAALYKDRCASCHEALAQSSIRNAPADAIRAAVTKVRQMKSLSNMTAEEVQAIAGALSAKSSGAAASQPASAPAERDGAALYQARCASCHRALAQSRVRGSSAGTIQRAIARKREMRSLSGMTAAEVQAVADALSRNPRATATNVPASAPANRSAKDD